MKVRLMNLAALAAITLTTQGVAQQNDSLERALADLNSGLATPDSSHGVAIGGDFRSRNRWFDDDSNTNNRDLDTRARLTFTFNVTENTTAFVGFNGRESWGDEGFGTTPDQFDDPKDEISLSRAWVSVDNLVGDGGTAKIGRDYYTILSGRIHGTDEWDNRPNTMSGVWYNHDAGGMNVHAAMLNGVENGYGSTAPVPTALRDEGDDMIYVFNFNYKFDMIEAVGPIHLSPYWIRNENTGAEHQTWMGAEISGEVAGFSINAEYATMDQGDVSGDAFYISTGLSLDALGSLPGVENGELSIAISGSDKTFATTGAVKYHNAAGFSDKLGAGGLWTADTDTMQLGLGFSPAEGWDGRIAYVDVESGAAEWSEIDVSIGKELTGNVQSWFGYAHVDVKGASVTEATFWAVLELAFGS